MNREYKNMWEVQQEMLGQWLDFSKKMFQPVQQDKKSRASGKKDKKASTVSPTNWPQAMTDFYQHWMKGQEEVARKWWKAFGEMSGTPDPYFSAFPFLKSGGDGARFWKTWLDQAEKFWPFMEPGEAAQSKFPFAGVYSRWMTAWMSGWKPQAEHLRAMGYDEEIISKYFTGDAYQEFMKKFHDIYPAETWGVFLEKTHKAFDQYIEFLNDVDLPFDEMAAFWDNMLVRLTPLDDVPLFRLGNNIHHYLEVMANPFYAIAGTPKLLKTQKAWRDIQFYYLSYLLKDTELRGKLLESSLAIMPETIRAYIEAYEDSGEMPEATKFLQHYIDNLENHLKKLLASDDYSRIQNEVARIGVTLKSKIDEFIELSVEGLPLMTRSDEDDIAREVEALRVKLRELSRKQKKAPAKKLPEEALN